MSLEISVKLNKIKNIESFEYDFRFERGIYALVGENAVGKSTVMAAIASTVYPKVISRYGKTEITKESSIRFKRLFFNKLVFTKIINDCIQRNAIAAANSNTMYFPGANQLICSIVTDCQDLRQLLYAKYRRIIVN